MTPAECRRRGFWLKPLSEQCAGRAGPNSSSRWLRSLRTSAGWPSSSHGRLRCPPHVWREVRQTWKTFLRNHMEGIASIDLFVVPTIAFQQLFAFLVLGHKRRQLLWFSVTGNPTAEWLARQITEAFPWDTAPKYLIRDNDRAFGAVFKARVRAMGIRDRPTSFRSPWQNGLVERLIGSARHECTDRVIVFNEDHLRRILSNYASYYNEVRTHLSLDKDAPCTRPIERFGDIIAQPILGGLHHRYARI